MRDGQRYAFTERVDTLGRSVIMPYLPVRLSLGDIPTRPRNDLDRSPEQ